MRTKIFTILSIILLFPELIVGQSTKQALEDFIHSPALQNASVGVSIKSFSGDVLVSHNADLALTPASILKVLTTATALEIFGSDYTYATKLGTSLMDQSKIIIDGSGDPTLGSEHMYTKPKAFLDEWADAIVSKIEGKKNINLFINDSHFGYDAVSKKWLREDIGNYYAPNVYGISIFDDTYRLFLNSTKANATPSIIKTEPYIKNLDFINMLSVNNNNRDNAFIIGDPFNSSRLLKGDIPNNRKAFVIKGSIPDPALILGEFLKERLETRGIHVDTITTAKDSYLSHLLNSNISDYREFHTHYSNSLEDIVRVINVRSNNHYAEHLIRTIGKYNNYTLEDALEIGITNLTNFWKHKGFDTKHLFMYDGCGLSPSNAISANFLTDVLVYMQTKSTSLEISRVNKASGDFISTLPIAGEEGTVRNFLKGTKLAGKLHLKSGSIAGVQCYSGYYINEETDNKYALTIIVNKFNSPRNQVVKAIRNLLLNVF